MFNCFFKLHKKFILHEFENEFMNRLQAAYICLHYPFLLPRTVNGRIYENNIISNFIRKYLPLSESFFTINIKTIGEYGKDITSKFSKSWFKFDDGQYLKINNGTNNISLTYENRVVYQIEKKYITNPENIVWIGFDDKNVNYPNIINIIVVVRERSDIMTEFIIDKFARDRKFNNLLKFLDKCNFFLQLFHLIPYYTYFNMIDCGWRKAFGVELCRDLKKAILKDGGIKLLYRLRITDIKEKYGTLRIHYNYGGDNVFRVTQDYEDLSYYTCIKCGKPATKISKGWICPYCDEHAPSNSVNINEENNEII